jgi:ABC-2 type transport system ATP-binding protein
MVSDPDVVIRCTGVSKRFGRVVALDGLDLSVPRGSVVGYLGPNGAGKSTTIRILLDLARPDAGEVTVLGVDPRRGGVASRRAIGYLPGELRLDERSTVAETLRSWEHLRGTAVDRTYVDELCDRLDLDQTRETRGLSSGNRRKVGLVGAFMARPELLILDEPTAGVDPLVQAEFLALVAEVRDRGATVFLSSHVLSEVQRAADHVVVIRAGQIVAAGSVDEVRHAARQPFVATFVGAPPVGELESIPGVGDVRVRDREVTGVIEGSPNALLAVLAKHPLEHLLLPEPDLEDAFLRFYEAERLP